MKNIRCPKCNSLLAKEEGDRIILRTGFGKRQVYHTFDVKNATITCWFCKEIKNVEERNNGKVKRKERNSSEDTKGKEDNPKRESREFTSRPFADIAPRFTN